MFRAVAVINSLFILCLVGNRFYGMIWLAQAAWMNKNREFNWAEHGTVNSGCILFMDTVNTVLPEIQKKIFS